MRTEKHLQKYLQKHCGLAGILCHKMESRSARGWPDMLCLFRGQAIFVELKSPSGTGRLHPLQIVCIADINNHGGDARVVSTPEQADELIAEMLDVKS